MRIAVIGSGISGLGCAHALHNDAHISLYEAESRLGGHTNTVDVTLDGVTYPVDTGFLVLNERTYPNLIRLLAELDVPIARSDMSFAVSVALGRRRLEWNGTDLNGVFAQRRNLVSPRFLAMLRDILRFNDHATRIALGQDGWSAACSLGEFLDRNGYGAPFRNWYLLPMAAAIWSCPIATMLAYPVMTFVRFCHNHGLLQVNDRPQWFTVKGGARQYVTPHRDQPPRGSHQRPGAGSATRRVERRASSCAAARAARSTTHVVLACHSDQAHRLLVDADRARARSHRQRRGTSRIARSCTPMRA